MLRKTLLGIVILFVIVQFIRPAKNVSADASKDISTLYMVPDDVKAIFQKACDDCHSNKTVYPGMQKCNLWNGG
jgi:uncharacterized membrane protein